MSDCFFHLACLYFLCFLEITYCFCNKKMDEGRCFRPGRACVCGPFPGSGPFCNLESLALSVADLGPRPQKAAIRKEKKQTKAGIPLTE